MNKLFHCVHGMVIFIHLVHAWGVFLYFLYQFNFPVGVDNVEI